MSLLAIDFSNLIVRHASNPYGQHKDAAGRPVWGVVGAISQVLRLLDQMQPAYLLIAKDGKREDSFRRILDTSYKAHREEEPDSDLTRQFHLAYRVIDLFAWPCVYVEHHEADDVIASACAAFNGRVDVVSGDKDMLALCSERVTVHLLRPGGVEVLGIEGCQRLMGVEPRQICDYKALVGDKSDGISGVEGVGPVNAKKLLEAYGSLARIYQHIDQKTDMAGVVTPAIYDKLVAGREAAYLSYRLASLVSDLSINVESLKTPERPTWTRYEDALREIGLSGLEKALTGRQGKRRDKVDLELVFRQLSMDI